MQIVNHYTGVVSTSCQNDIKIEIELPFINSDFYAYIVLSLLSYNEFEIHCFKLTCNYHLSQINI